MLFNIYNSLDDSIEPRKLKEIKCNVRDVNRRKLEMKKPDQDFTLSDILAYIFRRKVWRFSKSLKLDDLEDMVFRVSLTYSEIQYLLDKN